MDCSSSSIRSSVSDDNDGVITPVESEPQTPEVQLEHASLSSDTFQDVSWHEKEEVLSRFEGSGFLPASFRRLDRSSRPPPLAPFPSNTPTASAWFDDTPTQSMFSTENEKEAVDWEVQSEWLDDPESPVYSTFSQRESDKMSTFTFGRGGAISPSQSSESNGSSTMVLTENDDESIRSSKSRPFDSLDEQLLTSPIDSFAAMCWTSAISEHTKSWTMNPEPQKGSVSVPELRLSKLFNDTARDYEEYHSEEYSRKKSLNLPCMQFSGDFVPRTVSEEVAPWLYLPKKAVSVLDLPNSARTSGSKDESSPTTPASFRRVHRRGHSGFGTITGKLRRAIECVNGVHGRTSPQ